MKINASRFLGSVILSGVIAFCAIAFSTGTSAFAEPISNLTNEQKLSDLDQLVSLVKSGYGPLQYKKLNLNIDVDVLRATYAEKASQTKSNAEFYYLLMQFIAEFHDGHFRATLPTDRIASLPFAADLVEGKVLIDNVNRTQLPEAIFPFVKGDEIVGFGGRDIKDVVDELQKYRGLGFAQAERRIAVMALTMRTASRMPTPQGEVTIKVRRGNSDVVKEVTLKWAVQGQALDEILSSVNGRAKRFGDLTNSLAAPASANFDDLSIFELYKEIENPQVERSFRCSGLSRVEQPAKATVIMEAPFVAYYYPTAKGNIGYLRIPHYSPEDGNFDLRFSQYEYAVSELEKNTVGLVIDQDHNCGGSVDYLHRILSLFIDRPVAPMQFQLLANKEEYLQCQGWAKEAGEHTMASANVSHVCELIKAAWLKGDNMTPLTALDGQPLVYPNTIRYTKPIVMLIDELSGSGGDAFPSLMKGYGRAKLIGTRTMGLGGHVVKQGALFYSQITPEMTKSLFYRPDGVAVENHGAVPDFDYPITHDDFKYGYQDYRNFYTDRILELVE